MESDCVASSKKRKGKGDEEGESARSLELTQRPKQRERVQSECLQGVREQAVRDSLVFKEEVAAAVKLERARWQKEQEERTAQARLLLGMQEDIIKLNVGGTDFMVSKGTLMAGPDGYLKSAISGRFPVCQLGANHYFIDRDPTLFRHILNFIRDTASWEVPDFNLSDMKDFIRDAGFYGLSSDIWTLHPTVNGACYGSDAQYGLSRLAPTSKDRLDFDTVHFFRFAEDAPQFQSPDELERYSAETGKVSLTIVGYCKACRLVLTGYDEEVGTWGLRVRVLALAHLTPSHSSHTRSHSSHTRSHSSHTRSYPSIQVDDPPSARTFNRLCRSSKELLASYRDEERDGVCPNCSTPHAAFEIGKLDLTVMIEQW
ncbi:unnamed protein product [Chrysoparadoxa australica]